MDIVSSMATMTLVFTGLAMLYRLCKPFNAYTVAIFVSMLALSLTCLFAWPGFFSVAVSFFKLSLENVLFVIVLAFAAPTVISVLYKIMDKVKI